MKQLNLSGFPELTQLKVVNMHAKLLLSWATLFTPIDFNLSGPSVHGILQARILEWVAMPSSRGSLNPGIEPRAPALQADSSPSEPP